LANTTENILFLSRLDSNLEHGMTLDWQSLEEIVGAVLRRYRNRELPCKISSDVPSGIALIKADGVLLSQALANLIDNALAAHHGDEPVWVSVEERSTQVALSVKDRGAGFPEDFRVEDIRKFHRLSAGGKGMGLGLSIVQTIAQLHGAELKVGRNEGGGACVALIFPVNLSGDRLE
jgi:two-component system sensor histidine kinase KdpD